ncbi:MAG: hypothetical protein QW702_08755 [Candidatus Bathyarchaeia archaeon]
MRKIISLTIIFFLLCLNISFAGWIAPPSDYYYDFELSLVKVTKTMSSTYGYYINIYVNICNPEPYWCPNPQLRLYDTSGNLIDIKYFSIEPYTTLTFLLKGYLPYARWKEDPTSSWTVMAGLPRNGSFIQMGDILQITVNVHDLPTEENPPDPSIMEDPDPPSSYLPNPANFDPVNYAITISSDWQFLGAMGDWLHYSPTYWEAPYSNVYGRFMYGRTISNFQHFVAVISLEDYDIGGYWEISKAHHIVSFQLKGKGDKAIIFIIDHQLRIHLIGYKDVVTSACVVTSGSLNEGIPSAQVLRNMYVEIHAWKRSDNKLVVAYMFKWDYTENVVSVFDEAIIDVSNDWFDDVIILEIVEKALEWGAGASIKGGLKALDVTSGGGLGNAPYNVRFATWLETYRRNWWVIDTLFQIGSFLWSVLTLLWNFVIPNLPLLFSIYVFYLLYLVCLSLEDGNFGRLLDHFIKLGSFFVQIIQAIYQGVNTIISHFANLLRR